MSWEDGIWKGVPYTPGEQPKRDNLIKLNTNECPYPPAPGVEKKLKEMEFGRFRLYPDPEASSLVDALSGYYHVPSDQIFVGIGSDDVLAMAFLTYFRNGKEILFPNITYSFYDVWANLYNIPFRQIPLKEDFSIDPSDYKRENGGVVIANPNAPTSLFMPLSGIREILDANRERVVIVDEAYIDFGGETALPLIDEYENLLVVRTFSKSRAMAGMRIGYAFGSKKLIGYLQDAKFSFNSYTMNMPSLELGVEAVKDDAYFKEVCGKIVATRDRVTEERKALGFTMPKSSPNFLFASHEKVPAKELFETMKKEGILVRFFDKPILNRYLRITIGTDEQMDTMITFLKGYLASK